MQASGSSPRAACLHALVNNAGISPKGEGGSPARRDRDRARGLAARLPGELLRADHAGARPDATSSTRAKGAVVNVTSIAGSRVHPFAGAAYATSKAALASLTREMAADFGPLGVRVNAISPGEIDTAILSPGTEKIVGADPAAPPRHARRGRQGDLFPLHRQRVLRQRRRTAHQRRPACLETLSPTGRPLRKEEQAALREFCAGSRIAFHSPRIKSGVRCRRPGKRC